jgi:hypothetical protein
MGAYDLGAEQQGEKTPFSIPRGTSRAGFILMMSKGSVDVYDGIGANAGSL